jgi:decaprenylphospho-beta-D-ribofuranose 2-oxidase
MQGARRITYSGWGRVHRATGPVARPHAATAIDGTAPAFGNRRSYGDAALNDGGGACDMTAQNRILALDPETGILTAEAGVTLGTLARILPARGWLPPVLPGTGFATLGGAVAMDVHGKNHHTAGSFCQHVTALTLVQNGQRRPVTPETDPALWAATCGGLGQTGVITQVTLQLVPCPGDVMVVTERRVADWAEHIAHLDASDATYCVGWIDATIGGDALGRGILEEAEIGRGLPPARPAPRRVPLDAPQWALSAPIVRAFNSLYYRRVPAGGRTTVRTFDGFFFPLDRIHDWNRLYGTRGFHQFQCVVPPDRAGALRAMLAEIADSGLASPLAVLKRMGPGRAGYLSFPMEGYTLAVDFPNRAAARALIARLEDLTVAAGGRIYLAKDALATGDRVKTMYPDHPRWLSRVAEADPDGTLATDMVRRLDLRRT